MMGALLRKEWREHRVLAIALWALCFMGLSIFLIDANDDNGSPLIAFRQLLVFFGSSLAFILVNRLVVREYRGRTQFFLESLPVTRSQIVGTKFSIGLLLLFIPIVLCYFWAVFAARHVVTLNPSLLQWIAIRSGYYLVFVYTLAFAIAFTGRYRFVMWGVLIAAAIALNIYAQISIEHLPPFHLVTESMVFEHNKVSSSELWVSGSIIIILLAAAFALALSAEGNLIGSLYGPMSHREKVVITVVIMCVIVTVSEMDKRKPKPPFKLQDHISSSDPTPIVFIARDKSIAGSVSKKIATSINQQLSAMQDYLQLTTLPAVFVLPDSSLDADVYLQASLSDADGIVLRAAIASPLFNVDEFSAFAISQVLDWRSRGRTSLESKRWLRDGFAQWWMTRSGTAPQTLALRAAVANQMRPFNGDELRTWLTTREKLGDCLSAATAWRAVLTLSQQMNQASFQALLRSTLGTRPTDDSRAVLFDTTIAEELRRLHGPSLDALAKDISRDINSDSVRLHAQLGSIKPWAVHFSAKQMRGDAFEIHYSLAKPDETVTPFSIRYLELSPWQSELDRGELARVDAVSDGVLPLTVQRGSIMFTAVEIYNEPLACTLRIGAQRWEIP